MEKTEAVNKLKKAGYQVQFDSSVVTVLLTKKSNIASEIKKIRGFLREIGYEASFGVRQIKEDLGEDEIWDLEETDSVEIPEKEEEAEQLTVIEQFSLEDFGIS